MSLSAVMAWLSGDGGFLRWKSIIAIAALAAALGFSILESRRKDKTIRSQAQEIGIIEAANKVNSATIDALEYTMARTDRDVLAASMELDSLRADNRALHSRLRKAVKDVETLTLRDPWPLAVNHALCLRWLKNENRLPSGYQQANAAGSDPRKNDPVAAFCAGWHRNTPEDTLEWLGLLLDYAGEIAIEQRYARGQ